MAEIFPFPAYHYNTARLKLEDVLTQPYDKISVAMQEHYYAASPCNLISVEKGKSFPRDTPQDNVYTRAAQSLAEWTSEGILVRDAAPSLYVYSQEYVVPGTSTRKLRRGFISLGRLEDYSAGVVYRHEQTLTGPKADRLELLRRTRVQTGLLFMLYTDPDCGIEAHLDQAAVAAPAVEMRDEYGVLHRLWPLSRPEQIAPIIEAMADQKLVIADGHHRYETALAFRDECRGAARTMDAGAAHEKAMMAFFNSAAPGLTILPSHRVVANLLEFDFERMRRTLDPIFESSAYSFDGHSGRSGAFSNFCKDLAEHGRLHPALGVYRGHSAFHLFRLREGADLGPWLPGLSPAQRGLDVVLLHRLILEKGLGITAEAVTKEKNISYEREMEAAIAAVDSGRAQLCCLLNPVSVEKVCSMALAGEVLPQKATDFYPKLLSGLTIYRLEEESAWGSNSRE